MADDIVITEFGADLSKFNTEVDKAAKSVDHLDSEMKDAAKTGRDLSGNMGDAGKKVAVLGTESVKASKGVDEVGKSTGKATGLFSGMKSQLESTFPIFGKISAASKAMGTSITLALGPVGIAIAIVVGAFAALLKIFAGTEEGSERLTAIIEPLKAQFDALVGVLQVVGKVAANTVSLLFNIATGDFSGAAESFDALKASATEAVDAVSNIGNTLEEAGKKGARIAEIKEELEDLAINIATNEARINREFQEQYEIAGNVNASAKERQAAAEKAIELQKELTALKIKDLDLQIEELSLKQSLNDTSDEERLALAKLVAARDQALADELAATRRIKNTINTLNKQEADKAIAEGKRVAAERKKAEESAAKAVAAAREEARRSSLTPDEIKVDDIALRYQKEQDAAAAAFQALRELQKNNREALAKIDQDAADTVILIEANKQKALEDLQMKSNEVESKYRQDRLDAIYKATQDEADIQRDAINNQFNELENSVEELYAEGEERTQILLDLEQARYDALKEVKDANQIQDEADLKARKDAELAIIMAASDQLNTALEGVASGQIQTAEEFGKALVGITIDTISSIVQAQIVEVIAGSVANGVRTGGLLGGAAGLAVGTGLAAVLKGLLNALKGQLIGNYQGDPYVSGTPTWAGRDGYLRRLDEGERVVTKKDNVEHWDLFEAVRLGKLDQWKAQNMNPISLNFERIVKMPDTAGLMAYNFAPMVNNYVEGNSTLLTLPKGHDKGIIRASKESTREQRRTNDILEAMSTRKTSTPSKRLW
jgi:hypothetical protein